MSYTNHIALHNRFIRLLSGLSVLWPFESCLNHCKNKVIPSEGGRSPASHGDTDHCKSWRVPLVYDRPMRCAVLARVAGTLMLVVGWPPRLDGLMSDKRNYYYYKYPQATSASGSLTPAASPSAHKNSESALLALQS
jgi:hypothetical protein